MQDSTILGLPVEGVALIIGGLLLAGLLIALMLRSPKKVTTAPSAPSMASGSPDAEIVDAAPAADATVTDGAPELTETEIEALSARIGELSLPRLKLAVQEGVMPHGPLASYVGGPVYMPGDEHWPLSRANQPLVFLAQINFAEMPRLPDFPDKGVIQIFATPNQLFQPDQSELEEQDLKVIWRPDWNGEGLKRDQIVTWNEAGARLPFASRNIYENGARIAFDAAPQIARPRAHDWRLADAFGDWWTRPGHERLTGDLRQPSSADVEPHQIGGQSLFHETDVRSALDYPEYDRVLLQLGTDGAMRWPDRGGASLVIRRADLAAADFSRVILFVDAV